jgi:uncharacterized coiled-coil protein SlyX
MEEYTEKRRSDLETRLVKLEYITEGHSEELTELKDTSAELRSSLQGIQQTLAQIRWIAIGAGLMYFADQMGISSVLKVLAL